MRREEGTLGKDIAAMGSPREPLGIVSLWDWVPRGGAEKEPEEDINAELRKQV